MLFSSLPSESGPLGLKGVVQERHQFHPFFALGSFRTLHYNKGFFALVVAKPVQKNPYW